MCAGHCGSSSGSEASESLPSSESFWFFWQESSTKKLRLQLRGTSIAVRVFLCIAGVLGCLLGAKTAGRALGKHLLQENHSLNLHKLLHFVLQIQPLDTEQIILADDPGLEDGLQPWSLATVRMKPILMKYLKNIYAQDKSTRTNGSSSIPGYKEPDRLRSGVTSES